jgi:hypothetical protein
MPQNLSAQIVLPSTKVWDFYEKRLYWASAVREYVHGTDRSDPQMGAYGHNLCINDGLGVARYGKCEEVRKKNSLK